MFDPYASRNESVTFFFRKPTLYGHPDNKDTVSCPHGVRINRSPVFCPYYSSFRITRILFFELILLSVIQWRWRRGSKRPLSALFVVHLQSAFSVINLNVHKTRLSIALLTEELYRKNNYY